jgi:hypothetical protein
VVIKCADMIPRRPDGRAGRGALRGGVRHGQCDDGYRHALRRVRGCAWEGQRALSVLYCMYRL